MSARAAARPRPSVLPVMNIQAIWSPPRQHAHRTRSARRQLPPTRTVAKRPPLSATPRIATGTLDGFAGANEGAREFSIHFRRQPNGVDAGLGQERASILEAVDAPGIDLDIV